MSGADKMQLMGARVREQRAEMRAARTDKRDRRLRATVDALRADLERERAEREDLLDTLKHQKTVKEDKGMSLGGTMKLLVVGGAAYVLGAKAGRGRYEQIAEWARTTRDRSQGRLNEMADEIEDAAETSASSVRSTTTPSTTGTTTPGSLSTSSSRSTSSRTAASGA